MKRATGAAPVGQLTVDDLSRAYVCHRETLVRRATRKVQDQALAEEIVQEVFLKTILAAPQISSEDHLVAYLTTSVNNLCTTHARAKGIRPELVAIDSDMTAEQVNALIDESAIEMDETLTRAEDAAIVREAISRLSAVDRAVLLAEAYEGLSVREIAHQFGMTQESVHVAVSRARKNLRGILESWIIDEETGMTAAQFLSRAGKKVAENSKRIGSAALSLVLLIAAFFGFWNNPTSPAQVASPKASSNLPRVTALPATTPQTSSVRIQSDPHLTEGWALDYLSKTGPLGWPGLDSNGLPVGFTVNNGAGLNGLALITQEPFVIDIENGSVTTESRFTTFQDGLNVILAQKVTNKNNIMSYSVQPLVRVGGSWVSLEISETSTDIKKLDDGTFLITSWMLIDILKSSNNAPIAGAGLGTDLSRIPSMIATRLRTTATGEPVLGQAVQVLDPLAGQ